MGMDMAELKTLVTKLRDDARISQVAYFNMKDFQNRDFCGGQVAAYNRVLALMEVKDKDKPNG